MKLELKHMLPYLPFGLKCQMEDEYDKITNDAIIYKIVGLDEFSIEAQGNLIVTKNFRYTNVFPILKPLSDAKMFFPTMWEDDIDVRTFCNEDFLLEHGFDSWEAVFEKKVEWMPLGLFNLLVKYHFDVFDLIPNKLAIDVNKEKVKMLIVGEQYIVKCKGVEHDFEVGETVTILSRSSKNVYLAHSESKGEWCITRNELYQSEKVIE